MLKQCPACDGMGLEIISRAEVFEIKGEKITVDIKLYHCNECGNEFTNPKEFGDPFKLAYDEYRKLKGMVQPESIVAFRKKYSLSQKELSNLLGFGEATLSRYENGALQDQTHDNILKLIMNPKNLRDMLKGNLEAIDKEKKEFILTQIKNELSATNDMDCFFNDSIVDEFSGYSSLQINKVAEVIKMLCYNRDVFKTKLMKLLFYSDFINFKEHNRSITGLRYAHLPYGPVPDGYEFVLGAVMKNDPNISLEPRDFEKFSGEVICIKEIPKIEYLSEDEKDVIFGISRKFDYYSSKDISFRSHQETAYRETKSNELISYNFAQELNI